MTTSRKIRISLVAIGIHLNFDQVSVDRASLSDGSVGYTGTTVIGRVGENG